MTIEEARDLALNVGVRLLRLQQAVRQLEAQLDEATNVVDLLVQRLGGAPEGTADGDK